MEWNGWTLDDCVYGLDESRYPAGEDAVGHRSGNGTVFGSASEHGTRHTTKDVTRSVH